MKEKDNSKCKEWERRRREKLNDAFKCLCQLLPNYDPAKNLPKIDILERSTEFVKDLRLSNSRLLSQKAETDEKCKMIKELQDEVNKLIMRVQQLTTLLKQASIAIPLGPSIKSLGKKKLKWSNKLLVPENVENNSTSNTTTTTSVSIQNSTKGTIAPGTTNSSTSGDSTSALNINPLKETNAPEKDQSSSAPGTNVLLSNLPNTNIGNIPPTVYELPKSTSVQLPPLQTIYLTSCPITPAVVNQAPQVITRIALGPTRILPKPQDGITPLHKIAIRQIRKPLPPKEKKRRNRKKKIVVEKVDAETQSLSKTDETLEPKINIKETLNENIESLGDKPVEEIVLPVQDQIQEVIEITSTKEQIPTIITNPVITDNKESDSITPEISLEQTDKQIETNCELTTGENTASPEVTKLLEPTNSESVCLKDTIIMEMDISIAEEVEVLTQVEHDPLKKNSASTVDEDNSTKLHTAEQHNNAIEEEEIQINLVTTEPKISSSQTEMLSKESDTTSYMDISDFSQPKTVTAVPVVVESQESQDVELQNEVLPEASKSNQDSEPINVNIQPISAPNQVITSSISNTVTEDKISECIARSIDLIDGPDRELMELAENWGENVNSPKSPISPTHMFLNMFPLFTREMIVAVSETSQQGHSKNTYTPHKSFYIDSMLPEDNSVSSSNNNIDCNNPVIVSLAPASSSSIIQTPSNVQDSSTFRLTEISPVKPCTSVAERPSVPQASICHRSKHHENNKEVTTTALHQKSVQLSPQRQLLKNPNLLEFSSFQQPIPDYIENVFRDAARNTRNPTDCRHASGSMRSMLSNNPPDFVHPVSITNTPFHNPVSQKQGSVDIPNINSRNHQFGNQLPVAPQTRNHQPFAPQTSNHFMHQQPQSQSNITSCRPNNNSISNTTSLLQPENRGAFSYSIDHNLRHSYNTTNEPPTQQKQSTNASVKPQLFRPPVVDFQQQPVYHNLQQSFSNSKAPITSTAAVPGSKVVSKTLTSENPKRQKVNENIHVHQIPKQNFNTSVSNFSHNAVSSPVQSQTTQPHYQSIGIHMDKQPSQQPQQPRNYIQQQQKASNVTSISEPSKSYQKLQNKELNQSLTRSTSTTCQSRRHHTHTSSSTSVPVVIPNPTPEVLNSSISNHPSQQQSIPPPVAGTQNRRSSAESSSSRNQNQAVSSFPDFSLSMNFNNQTHQSSSYEPYSINYPPSGISQPLQPTNPIIPPQPRKTSTRPTPFYLQDVSTHCESFSFDPSTSSNNPLLNQQIVNQPYNVPKSQFPNSNPPVHPLSSSTSHYFPTASESQSQSTCQGTYGHQSSSNNMSSRNQQHHSTNVVENPLLYNPIPPSHNNNANQHQTLPQSKSKPIASTSSQPSQHNQTNYGNNQASSSENLPNTNSSSSSSRPVNWMTDTPYTRTNNKSSPSSTNPTAASNPFSVSKLVGNTSTQNNNANNASSSGTSSNICINNRNTNYCAEALIRKNPSWNNLNFGSSSVNQQQQQHQQQQVSSQPSSTSSCISYQSSNEHNNINFPNYPGNFPHHSHYPNPNSSSGPLGNQNVFSHFDPMIQAPTQQGHQQHQYHFSQPHGSSSTHHHNHNQTHHGQTTSSVSNFNLSSIFPEINDKRHNANTSSTNNTNVPPGSSNNNSTANNNNNNCGYYTSTTHGNARK